MNLPSSPALPDDVLALLGPEGPFAAAWPGFENRPGQRALAGRVAETIERGGVLLAEAPTGLGKSLAYLLPAILDAARSGHRIVVATATKGLQDQLFERDLPAVQQTLGISVYCVRLKGKQNYLCPRAMDMATPRGEEEHDVLEALRAWAARDDEADLDRFPAPDAEAFRRLRPSVATDPDACTLLSCRRGRECPWVRARRLATEGKILVVNHALLARASETDGILPEFDALVIDEGHRLEEVVISQLERNVSRHRFEELLRALGGGKARRSASGLLGRARIYERAPLASSAAGDEQGQDIDSLLSRLPEVRAAVDRLFVCLEPSAAGARPYSRRERYLSAHQILGPDLDPLEQVLAHCAFIAAGLHRHADRIAGPDARPVALEISAELEQQSAKWTMLRGELLDLCEAANQAWVYWRSSGGTGGVRLHGVPVSAGEYARRLMARARSVVITSATLTTGGDFGFTAGRLGLGEEHGVPYDTTLQPSPFDLPRQTRSFVFTASGREEDVVSEAVAALAKRTGRSQLVLFTAHERLKRARERLMTQLDASVPLFAQEWDGSVSQLSERFRMKRGSILLGVQSLWEGVDFPGAELEIVVVAKLPFSVPDDPRVEARGERLREAGLDPFRSDAVPEAVLRFRQGVGRLIRRAADRGVLVVCDPRLVSASYRSPFLNALPAAPKACADARTLADHAADFFEAAGTMEELA